MWIDFPNVLLKTLFFVYVHHRSKYTDMSIPRNNLLEEMKNGNTTK